MNKLPEPKLPTEFHITRDMIPVSICPRKWFYSRCLRLEPDGASRTALKYGEAIHAALPTAFLQSRDAAVAIFDKVWDRVLEDDHQKKKGRTRKRAIASIDAALVTYPPSQRAWDILDPADHGIKVITDDPTISPYELPFHVYVDDIDIPVAGRLDGLVRLKATGDIYALEIKTSFEVSDRLFKCFSYHPQTVGYPSLVNLKHPKLDLKGTLPLIVRTSYVNAEVRPAPLLNLQPHHTSDFFTDLRDSWETMKRVFDKYTKEATMPVKKMSNCTTYPGHGIPGYRCKFAPLCEAEFPTHALPLFREQVPNNEA